MPLLSSSLPPLPPPPLSPLPAGLLAESGLIQSLGDDEADFSKKIPPVPAKVTWSARFFYIGFTPLLCINIWKPFFIGSPPLSFFLPPPLSLSFSRVCLVLLVAPVIEVV